MTPLFRGVMGLFSNLFGSGSSRPRRKEVGTLEERLAALEKRSRDARPGQQGIFLNKAGDLCLETGDRERALSYYGRAIDLMLDEGQPEVARGVANKIIRIHPEAVRTFCTLTWLDLASRHTATALVHLRQYVEGVKRVRTENLARDHILDMARVVPDAEFIEGAADALDLMDFSYDAAQIRQGELPGADPVTNPADLARICIRHAAGSNADSTPSI